MVTASDRITTSDRITASDRITESGSAQAGTLRLDSAHRLTTVLSQHLPFSGSLQVELDDDRVVLSGNVNSWYAKQLAQETIRPAVQTARIHNRIRVVPETPAE